MYIETLLKFIEQGRPKRKDKIKESLASPYNFIIAERYRKEPTIKEF